MIRWLLSLFASDRVSDGWLRAQRYDRSGVDLPYWRFPSKEQADV